MGPLGCKHRKVDIPENSKNYFLPEAEQSFYHY